MILKKSSENNSYDNLLSAPSENADNQQFEKPLTESYVNHSKKYLLGNSKNSSRQYYEMYTARLRIMRSIVENKIKQKWGDVKINRLHELQEDESCFIIGTLVKRQDLKPSILKELSEENQLIPQPVLEKFTSDNDEIILEDELQRIQLKGKINIHELVTGIVCGVKGFEESGGKFFVEEICFAGVPSPVKSSSLSNEDKFVLFISGLELQNESMFLSLQLLVDYLTGHLGSPSEQREVCNITRIIIAGNSICGTAKDGSLPEKVKLTKLLDDILAQLSNFCPVDLMPGEFDPSNHVMPQQPFHSCLFPRASKLSYMQSVTNPYEFELEEKIFIGTSGQNVKDISLFSAIDDPIQILENICNWGHLAPSAPETLLSYPYYSEEPFIIDKNPDILFAGNQKHLASKLVTDHEKTRLLISIPKFCSTGTCVRVNLKTLEVMPLKFNVNEGI